MMLRLSLLSLFALASFSSQAATVDSSFQAEVSVPGRCVITSPTSLAFGSYDKAGANYLQGVGVASSLNIKCTAGTPSLIVYVNKGLHDGGAGCDDGLRRMRGTETPNTNSYLGYRISSTPNSSPTAWGCAPGAAIQNGGVATGAFSNAMVAISLPIYGFIAPGVETPNSYLVVGSYSDTINFFVNF